MKYTNELHTELRRQTGDKDNMFTAGIVDALLDEIDKAHDEKRDWRLVGLGDGRVEAVTATLEHLEQGHREGRVSRGSINYFSEVIAPSIVGIEPSVIYAHHNRKQRETSDAAWREGAEYACAAMGGTTKESEELLQESPYGDGRKGGYGH